MPVPIAGAILGSAALGAIGASRAASAQKSAANKAADASAYATDQQIAAQERWRKEAVDAATTGNKTATNALVKAATGTNRVMQAGSKRSERATLAANDAAANAIAAGAKKGAAITIGNALADRNVTIGGSRKAEMVGKAQSKKAAGVQITASKTAERATVAANLANNKFFKDIAVSQSAQLKPWRVAGQDAIKSISAGLKNGAYSMDTWNFQADPSYQFRKEQGQQALDRSAAASGGLLSGRQQAATADYNSGLASTEYAAAYAREQANRQNKFTNTLTVADRGQQAANDTNAILDTYGQRVGAGNLAIGAARATGATTRAGYAAGGMADRATLAAQGLAARTGAASDFYGTQGATGAALYQNLGSIRGAQAATRGNVIAQGAVDRAGYQAAALGGIGQARAQGALNVANAASSTATNAGNQIAAAYQQNGVNQANAATARGQAAAQGAADITGAINGGLSNWLTYKMAGIG